MPRPGWWVGNGGWDGARYLHADDGNFRIFNGRDGTRLPPAHPLGDKVVDVVYTPDRTRAVAAELDRQGDPAGRPLLRADRPFGRTGRHPVLPCGRAATTRPSWSTAGSGRHSYWNVPADRWALVDLDAGVIRAEGALDVQSPVWAAISPDGHYAAVTGTTGQVEIIDLGSGRPVRPATQAHDAGVYWAAFSPDGSQLVTNAQDGSVVLWDTRLAEIRATVQIKQPGPDDWAASASEFRPDGRTLLIAPQFGHAVYVWDPSAQRALDFACRMAGRDLTEAEWAENFPDQPYRHVCPAK